MLILTLGHTAEIQQEMITCGVTLRPMKQHGDIVVKRIIDGK